MKQMTRGLSANLCLALLAGLLAVGTASAQSGEASKDDDTKTKQAQAVSKEVYEKILKAQEAVEAKDYRGALDGINQFIQLGQGQFIAAGGFPHIDDLGTGKTIFKAVKSVAVFIGIALEKGFGEMQCGSFRLHSVVNGPKIVHAPLGFHQSPVHLGNPAEDFQGFGEGLNDSGRFVV